jgi:hypothetical protein
MTTVERIESGVSKFLQRNISFHIENKTLKKGKLILFSIKDFFCIFTLLCEEKNNKKIILELPYPFEFDHHPSKIVFDYTIDTFCKHNNSLYTTYKKLNIIKPSKLFNKKLIVKLVV